MKAVRIIKKAAVIVLCILMFVSAAAGILGLTLAHTMQNGAELALRIADGEYCLKMYETVYAALEKKMALVVIETDDISEYLTESLLADNTKLAAATVVKELLGEESAEWSFESEDLRAHIEVLLEDYASDTGIEYEDGSADQVYDMICDTVTAELRVVPQTYAEKITPAAVKIQKVLALWYIPVILYAVLLAAVLLLHRRHIKSGLYSVFMTSYFSMFTLFAASAILYSKDYLERTVLGDGMLQALIRGLYNAVLYDVRQITMMLTLAFLLMSIAIIIALAMKGQRHRRKKSIEETE